MWGVQDLGLCGGSVQDGFLWAKVKGGGVGIRRAQRKNFVEWPAACQGVPCTSSQGLGFRVKQP